MTGRLFCPPSGIGQCLNTLNQSEIGLKCLSQLKLFVENVLGCREELTPTQSRFLESVYAVPWYGKSMVGSHREDSVLHQWKSFLTW